MCRAERSVMFENDVVRAERNDWPPLCTLLENPLLEPREKRGTPSFYRAKENQVRLYWAADLGHPPNRTRIKAGIRPGKHHRSGG